MANHELTEESITHKGYEDNLRLWWRKTTAEWNSLDK